MIPLNLILSTTETASKAPEVVVAVCALILLAAFFIGFSKGFKQVGWEWMTCLAAFVGFVYLDKYLRETGLGLNFIEVPGLSARAFTTFVIAFGCLAIMLVVYGLFSAAFRPRAVWQKKSKRQLEMEQENGIGDGNPEHLVWKNCATPKFYGRFWGSIICMANTAVILALIVSLGMLVISGTELSTTWWGDALKGPMPELALKYAKLYALDFLTLCIPFFVACYGYKRGLVGSLRSIIMKVGGILVISLAFGLPFIANTLPGEVNAVGNLVNNCTALMSKLPEMFQEIAGKLLAGLLLLALFGGILALVDYLLGKCHEIIKNGNLLRVMDSVVSCSLYFLLGVVLCVALWAVLYTLDATQIFKVSAMIGEDTAIAKDMMDFVKTFMDGILAPLIGAGA